MLELNQVKCVMKDNLRLRREYVSGSTKFPDSVVDFKIWLICQVHICSGLPNRYQYIDYNNDALIYRRIIPMLKAKSLSNLLGQSLSGDITCAFLFSTNGALLAQASESQDQRRSRVIAAIAARMWTTSDGIDDQLDNAKAVKGDDWLCVDLKVIHAISE